MFLRDVQILRAARKARSLNQEGISQMHEPCLKSLTRREFNYTPYLLRICYVLLLIYAK